MFMQKISNNIMLNVDSYKVSMPFQYPENTQYVYSYIESRGGVFDKAVFFGLQAFLLEYMSTPITAEMVDEAAEVWAAHGEPFYREGWDYIVREHDGKLPVKIKAAPEGSIIETHNILLSIVNTDPKCWWLTTYLETALLRAIWYPTTVASNSFACKIAIWNALVQSCDDPANNIAFRLHDFGARGVSSLESAALGGMAHLVNFQGTDTISGALAAKYYYGAEGMAGFSIPAAEHSTITTWGREDEVNAYRNMLKQFGGPGKVLAVVSDSYDIYNASRVLWGDVLKQEVIDSGATIVVRPDSGDACTVPVEIVQILSEQFGYTVNSKGYKVLPSCIRVIQGDGITHETIPVILENLLAAGFSAENLTFGMGGGLLQQINRDTMKFAMKCSAAKIGDNWVDVYKDPITDHGKKSKKGVLQLRRNDAGYHTVRAEPFGDDLLLEVYQDGDILLKTSFEEVRTRASEPFTL